LFTMIKLLLLSILLIGVVSDVLAEPVSELACDVPSNYNPAAHAKLPDPFTSVDGSKITTKAQWACRQNELSLLFQKDELGDLPAKPSVNASFSGSSLSISVTVSGKSISFSVSIRAPSSGSAPFPAIIAFGSASLPIPSNVATITFNNDDIAAQQNSGSRGLGKFYTLYGNGHSAGALLAWAWGVSRIIDAIEITSAARIDPKRIGVTGCSRNGKGAFVAGAFDNRIALTLAQESGAGGSACWRVSDSEKSKGKNIQTASQIITENVWFSKNFDPFTRDTTKLPIDHHELAALIAPRGLFVIENDVDWLGPVSTTACMKVARLIYKAAGAADAMGFSLVGGHNHCSFPSSQQADLTAFIDKYLLNGPSSTANIERSNQNVDAATWIDWTVPTLG